MERTLHGYGYKPNQLLHHVNGNLILLKPWPSTKLQLMQKLEAFYYSLFTVYWNSSDVSKFRPSEFVTLRLVCNFKRVKNPIHFVKTSKWVKKCLVQIRNSWHELTSWRWTVSRWVTHRHSNSMSTRRDWRWNELFTDLSCSETCSFVDSCNQCSPFR